MYRNLIMFFYRFARMLFDVSLGISSIACIAMIVVSLIGAFTSLKVTATPYFVFFMIEIALFIFVKTYMIWIERAIKTMIKMEEEA